MALSESAIKRNKKKKEEEKKKWREKVLSPSLGDDIVISYNRNKDTWTKTFSLTDSKGNEVRRKKRIGGSDRMPIYEDVKKDADYLNDKKVTDFTEEEYDKLLERSTIQVANPNYEGKKKKMVNPNRGFRGGGIALRGFGKVMR